MPNTNSYKILKNEENVTIKLLKEQIDVEDSHAVSDVVAYISGNDGYLVPANIEVLINGEPCEDYAYSYGKLIIPAYIITGDIEIKASGIEKSRDIISEDGDERNLVSLDSYVNILNKKFGKNISDSKILVAIINSSQLPGLPLDIVEYGDKEYLLNDNPKLMEKFIAFMEQNDIYDIINGFVTNVEDRDECDSAELPSLETFYTDNDDANEIANEDASVIKESEENQDDIEEECFDEYDEIKEKHKKYKANQEKYLKQSKELEEYQRKNAEELAKISSSNSKSSEFDVKEYDKQYQLELKEKQDAVKYSYDEFQKSANDLSESLRKKEDEERQNRERKERERLERSHELEMARLKLNKETIDTEISHKYDMQSSEVKDDYQKNLYKRIEDNSHIEALPPESDAKRNRTESANAALLSSTSSFFDVCDDILRKKNEELNESANKYCEAAVSSEKQYNSSSYNLDSKKQDFEDKSRERQQEFVSANFGVDAWAIAEKTRLTLNVENETKDEMIALRETYKECVPEHSYRDSHSTTESSDRYTETYCSTFSTTNINQEYRNVYLDTTSKYYEDSRKCKLDMLENNFKTEQFRITSNTSLSGEEKSAKLHELTFEYNRDVRNAKEACIIAQTQDALSAEIIAFKNSIKNMPVEEQKRAIDSFAARAESLQRSGIQKIANIESDMVRSLSMSPEERDVQLKLISEGRAGKLEEISGRVEGLKKALSSDIESNGETIAVAVDFNKMFAQLNALGGKDNEENQTFDEITPITSNLTAENVKTFLENGNYAQVLSAAQKATSTGVNYANNLVFGGTEVGAGMGSFKEITGVAKSVSPFGTSTIGSFAAMNYCRDTLSSLSLNSNFNALSDSMYESFVNKEYKGIFGAFNENSDINKMFNGPDSLKNLWKKDANGKMIIDTSLLMDSKTRGDIASVLSETLKINGIKVNGLTTNQLKKILNDKNVSDDCKAALNLLIVTKEVSGLQAKHRAENEADVLSKKTKGAIRSINRRMLQGTEAGSQIFALTGNVRRAKNAYREMSEIYAKIMSLGNNKASRVIISTRGQYGQKQIKRAKKVTNKYEKYRKKRELKDKRIERLTFKKQRNRIKDAASEFVRKRLEKTLFGQKVLVVFSGVSKINIFIQGLAKKMIEKLLIPLIKYLLIGIVLYFVLYWIISLVISVAGAFMSIDTWFEPKTSEEKLETTLEKCISFVEEKDEEWWNNNVYNVHDSIKSVNDGSKMVSGFIKDMNGNVNEINSFGSADGSVAETRIEIFDAVTHEECAPESNIKALLSTYDVWATFCIEELEGTDEDDGVGAKTDDDSDVEGGSFRFKKAKKFINSIYDKLKDVQKSVYQPESPQVCKDGDTNVTFYCNDEEELKIFKDSKFHAIWVDNKNNTDSSKWPTGSVNTYQYIVGDGRGCSYIRYMNSGKTITYNDVTKITATTNPGTVTKKIDVNGTMYQVTLNKDLWDYCNKNNVDISKYVVDTGKTTNDTETKTVTKYHSLSSGDRVDFSNWAFYYGSSSTAIAEIRQGNNSITCNNTKITGSGTVNINIYTVNPKTGQRNDYNAKYAYKNGIGTLEVYKGTTLYKTFSNVYLYTCSGYAAEEQDTKSIKVGKVPDDIRSYYCPGHDVRICTGHVTELIHVELINYSEEAGAENNAFFDVITENCVYEEAKEIFRIDDDYASEGEYYRDCVAKRVAINWEEEYGVTSYAIKMEDQKMSFVSGINESLLGLISTADGTNIKELDFEWPVPNYTYISSSFEPRWGSFHYGIDIASGGNIDGIEVDSVGNGTVVIASEICGEDYRKFFNCGCNGGYGNLVVVDYGHGIRVYYAHLRKVMVHAGDTVTKGQQIATMGCTGYSTGQHLHLEIQVGSGAREKICVDPKAVYSSTEYAKYFK